MRLQPAIKSNRGFTLIELLVVIVILGILSAVSLPAYLKQVGKARETEAKKSLSSIAFSQQAYHFENQSFATNINQLDVDVPTTFYTLSTNMVANGVRHQAQSQPDYSSSIRNYAMGIYFDPTAATYTVLLCQASDVNTAVNAPPTSSASCTNGGVFIR